jgi:hypothetical protein
MKLPTGNLKHKNGQQKAPIEKLMHKTCAEGEADRAVALNEICLAKFGTLAEADKALQRLITDWREESTILRQAERVLFLRGAGDLAMRVQYMADAIDHVSKSLEEWADIPF